MKKLIFILILAALTAVSMATHTSPKIDRTGVIRTGYSQLSTGISLSATDFVQANDTLDIAISNSQKYFQHFSFTTTLTTVSGSPSVSIEAWGKVTSGDAWTQIGSTNTWTSSSNNPVTITSTTAANYNYLLVRYIASGTTQKAKVSTFDVRTANMFDIPVNSGTLTISRATSGSVTIQTADDNANAAAVYRAGGTGALTLGAAAGTTAITSSDWAIGATGIATGMGAISMDGLLTGTLGATITGATVNLNATSNFAVNIGTGSTNAAVSIGGGSNTVAINSTALDISTTGAITGATTIAASGAITASGGVVLPDASPIIWAQSGAVDAATVAGDSAGIIGRRYWVEIYIPYNVTLTGVAYLVGSVGGTDSVVVQLCNSTGVEVATSRNPGTAANIIGTAAQFQSVAFDAAYAAVAGRYYVVVQYNGTTAKLRTHSITGCKFIAGTAGGAWGTKANITPGTTYTVGKAPFLMTY